MFDLKLLRRQTQTLITNWASLNCECVHVWINKCTTQKSSPMQRWLFFWSAVSQTGWYRFSKGSLILAVMTAASSARLSYIAGINTNAHVVAFWGAPFCHGLLHGASYQPVGLLSSQSPPSCSPVFDSAIVLFFPQGLHLVVKMDPLAGVFFFFLKDIITNAHQLTGTRLDLFINSLWFNSLTLLPCYANSCGQSMTPSCWGLDR